MQSEVLGALSEFGRFTLDHDNRQLLCDGRRIALDPKALAFLELTFEQCRKNFDAASAWSISARPNAACASCMCECNPTASGNCDACRLLTSCASSLCALATPGDGVRSCLEDFCTAKLLPNYILDSLVEVTPCTARCAAVCAF